MGTPGVPIKISKDQILEAIKKKKGVGSHICKHFDMSYDTFYKLIKQYDLKEELDAARNAFAETLCDSAENILMIALNQKEDLGNALGAARFVLNNKGRNRGYYPPTAPPEPKDTVMNEIRAGIKELSQESRSATSLGPEVAPK